MAHKDKDHKLQKSDIIFKFRSPHINCPEQYIGESCRTLGDELRNTSGSHLSSTNTAVPQGIQLVQTILPSYIGNHKAIQETFRKPCSSGSVTPHLMETWESTSCHAFGIQYYRTLILFSSSNPQDSLSPPSPPPLPGLLPTPTSTHICSGGTNI